MFQGAGWPKGIQYHEMQQYYDRARAILAPAPVPDALNLLKVKALETLARGSPIPVTLQERKGDK